MSGGEAVLARLREQPGGHELTQLAGTAQDEVALVGGAVRDLLLERRPKELDVVVAEDAGRFARELAAALGSTGGGENPALTLHDRFGTAAVRWPGGRIDVARRRAESYPVAGALPQVRPGSLAEDLQRRDFTVNALAVPLAGPSAGELLQAEPGREDLEAGLMRVLHEQSFIDDPTRLLRLGRYRARLGFQAEPETARLACEAIAAGALGTVSGARIGAELRLALQERDALAALGSLAELGVISAIGLAGGATPLDEQLAQRALGLLPGDASRPELLLALLLLAAAGDREQGAEARLRELLDRLEFTAGERDRALRAALGAPALAERMGHAAKRSQLREALAEQTPQAVALAGALGEHEEQARLWFDELSHVRLAITGDDLLDAGLAPGPQIGIRLQAALACKLDGELPEEGAAGELKAALEASP